MAGDNVIKTDNVPSCPRWIPRRRCRSSAGDWKGSPSGSVTVCVGVYASSAKAEYMVKGSNEKSYTKVTSVSTSSSSSNTGRSRRRGQEN